MNALRTQEANMMLTPVNLQPQLTVVQGMPRTRESLLDRMADLAFGYLHGGDFSSDVHVGGDFSSDVHDVLDSRTHHVFLNGMRERIFALVACTVAIGALFVFSFM